jgi:orotidine-5'-phosphate decarboxylase
MTALDKLLYQTNENKHVCIGLDTDLNKIPSSLKQFEDPTYEFNRRIIEATCTEAAAYKLNFAFYEKYGERGMESLRRTIEVIPKSVLIIGDAKRGDIGNTSAMYAASIFEHFKCDAATLNPYMGFDSLQPFLEYKDKLNFILALTSNPSSVDFEKLILNNGEFLYQNVIKKISLWDTARNCGAVFGATNITELKENLDLLKDIPVLLPGIGAQGGNIHEVVVTFKGIGKSDYIINVSRSIIYFDSSDNFADSARNELLKMNKIITQIKLS